jgi:hypothetical protein
MQMPAYVALSPFGLAASIWQCDILGTAIINIEP